MSPQNTSAHVAGPLATPAPAGRQTGAQEPHGATAVHTTIDAPARRASKDAAR